MQFNDRNSKIPYETANLTAAEHLTFPQMSVSWTPIVGLTPNCD